MINRAHLHWKLGTHKTALSFNAIGFSLLNNKNKTPSVGEVIDIIYFPRINTYGGNITLQLYIKDFIFSE